MQPTVLNYYSLTFSSSCAAQHSVYEYSTDALANKSLFYINDAVVNHPEQPFYIQISPIAPHQGCGPGENQVRAACFKKTALMWQ